MKKIMFNDRYGLTQAVTEGRKTMTRRIILSSDAFSRLHTENWSKSDVKHWNANFTFRVSNMSNEDRHKCLDYVAKNTRYKLGEVVAVAQSYEQVYHQEGLETMDMLVSGVKTSAGWSNKMFVRADLMPYRIRITGIRCERLQDISGEDCLAEGVATAMSVFDSIARWGFADDKLGLHSFETPREAFAALIDRVSGKGTWERNPWVVVYEFELLKAE